MTMDVERFAFLLNQLPACTQSPVKAALGADLHRELRAKYKLELGIDLMRDRCDNLFNCVLQGSGCIGRPMPLDDQVLSALQSTNCTVTIGNHKGHQVYLAKSKTCNDCPFKTECSSPCATQESYLKRSIMPDLSPRESMLVNFDDFEEGRLGLIAYDFPFEAGSISTDYSWMDESLPMDCLTSKQRQVIEMIDFKGLDQVKVALDLKMTQSAVSQMYHTAYSKLIEFGRARRCIKNQRVDDKIKLYYINNLTSKQISDRLNITPRAVTSAINRWKVKNNIP